MPIIIACPSCGGKLRVADALRGHKVRCPTCSHIFGSPPESGPPDPPPPALQDLPLELTIDDLTSPPPASSIDTPGLLGAIELKPSVEDPPASLKPAIPPQAQRKPPRLRDDRIDVDIPDIRRMGLRRDAEPDRGSTVLALGIISLAVIFFWCAAPVGAILGLAAWIMGQTDLRKMKRGQMDENGRGMTQAGWICGILGTFLNGLVMLGCGLLFFGIWYSEKSRPPNTSPVPVIRPAQPIRPGQPKVPPMKKRQVQ
jgi:predicted Zn finger-like uncharacterized protein